MLVGAQHAGHDAEMRLQLTETLNEALGNI